MNSRRFSSGMPEVYRPIQTIAATS
jgi:hypothetical protein